MADLLKVKNVKLESGAKYQRLFNKDSGTSGMKSGHITLKEGEEIGEHSTNDLEEALVILKGNGQLVINNEKVIDFEADTVLYVPSGTIHNVKNIGKEILEYIFVTSYASEKK
ncbi:MAG: cupin domain-containing protein [Candidatus Omnitrophica bacterium]|nr:cupin domain-containing protein [Candidatus Omnitrophota bacterium]